MLILAKSILGLMLSFFISIITGFILIPILRKLHFGQNINSFVEFTHKKKQGTPTIGGLIFIIPTIITMLLIWAFGKSVEISHTIGIVLFVFIAYALLGFADDFKKIRSKSNFGLNTKTKLIVQLLIAIIFFFIFMKGGESTELNITALNLHIDLGWFYGVFVLFLLVGSSNAVNITDGLDGLAGGLSMIAFLAFGILAWSSPVVGNAEIAIFCFALMGALLGFLVFNSHPAKVFMGDTGSLALGATLATVAILTRHELSLALVGGVFVVETLSSLIQIIAIRKFHRKVFLIAPLHHHFEKLGWEETDIVKMFWVVGFMLAMGAIVYGVWI